MSTVWDSVCSRANATGTAVAIRGAKNLSYDELTELVVELSETIRATSAPGSLLALDASMATAGAVAILAAARARRAILPLNTDMPPLLRDAVLADARPELLIKQEGESDLTVEPRHADTAKLARPDMKDIAYVLYTSGSTGHPKGVLISHTALKQRLEGLAAIPGLRRGESILAMTALSFDIVMAELLLPLTVGASFIAAPSGTRLDPEIFAGVVDLYGPDVIQATPSFWRLALAWGWRGAPNARIWCGGEALTRELAGRLIPRCGQVWNVYGPTEATIWATAHRVRADSPISLGAPLPGSGFCIEDLSPGPADRPSSVIEIPGQPGEILLYGNGLATGYLNLEDLTKERFCVCDTPDGPQRCYRTGDRAQYRKDGSIEFLGRTDDQVKLRGHRFELGDVEATLEQYPGVSEAAAVIRDSGQPEQASLVVFLVTDAPVSVRAVRRWIADRLPPVMRPSHIYLESSLPHTTAAKLDRVRLGTLGARSGRDNAR